jgi:hypothetical protein
MGVSVVRGSGPKSFWDQAALRAQAHNARPAWTEEEKKERKPLRRDPPPAPPPLVPTTDQLRLRIAEEIEYARRMLDSMGDELCGDAAILVRHGSALQAVDVVGQMLGQIATVIRCIDQEAAVERIGNSEMKGRLKRRSVV